MEYYIGRTYHRKYKAVFISFSIFMIQKFDELNQENKENYWRQKWIF